jgi:predicted phage tail protein
VHQRLGLSRTKTVVPEKRRFVEVEELKQLPNNVAIVLPSNGIVASDHGVLAAVVGAEEVAGSFSIDAVVGLAAGGTR